MKPADIGDLVDVGDVRLSPDGREAAYVVTTLDLAANAYRRRIWVAPTDGQEPPRPLTSGFDGDGLPRWSPDGQSIAFVSHRGEVSASQLRVVAAGHGEGVEVVACDEEIAAIEWSPDGTAIAFAARASIAEPSRGAAPKDQPPRRITRLFTRRDGEGWTFDRPRQLFVVAADGSTEPKALTSGPFETSGLSWSPDGGVVAFASARHERHDLGFEHDLFTVATDRTGTEPTLLTETSEDLSDPTFSPDGRMLAYVWDDALVDPCNAQVGVLSLDTRARRLLSTGLDRNTRPYGASRGPVWNGKDVLFLVEEAGDIHLYRTSPAHAKPEVVLGGERQITSFDAQAGVIAFVAGDAAHLNEVFVLDGSGKERRLTGHGKDFASAHPLAPPERFTAASADGTQVDAWLIRPVGFDATCSYPTLVNIHGGPFIQYGSRFIDDFQVQAGAGYVVVYANPRGSSGYGEAWGRAIRGPIAASDPGHGWGSVDYEDVMAVTSDAVRRFPFIDGERLGVLGGSYGGYLTSWIVSHTDRFHAACSERSLNNLMTFDQHSEIAGQLRKSVGASHLEAPEEYRRQSPTSYIREIHTPLLLIHGENDLHCPISQAEELFVGLRLLGREVELARFPGEGHGMARSGSPRHRVMRLELLLEFFGRHLRPSVAGTTAHA